MNAHRGLRLGDRCGRPAAPDRRDRARPPTVTDVRLAHVRERHAPTGAPWRLAAALDAGDAPRRWLDLEAARRRAVASHAELAHNELMFRRPIRTLDDHLAAGPSRRRVAGDGGAVRTTRANRTRTRLSSTTPTLVPAPRPAPAVAAGLLRVRAACRDDVGAAGRRDPGGMVPVADLLLQQRLGNSRTRRPCLGAARLDGARLRG